MAFDDKGWPVFPTRHGDPAGAAIENRMISKVGGPNTIRTEIQNLPDGEVMLRTRNGMPEFTRTSSYSVTSSTCSLEMDSGIVDILSASEYVQGFTNPGIMRNTDYVAAHTAGATDGTAVGCGKLKYPSMSGQIIQDGAEAKAFRPSFSGGTSYTDRKKIANRIPPSIFTGRMRLYVQSLYGGNWNNLVLSDASSGVGRPMLGINLATLELVGETAQTLRSGTGLYFDASTKQHYLIMVGSDVAYVTKLVGSACAEAYRLRLLTESLSTADQERIEAYILSQSFPDVENVQTLSFEETPTEGLGYSWHWNWDGDKCDIVDVQEASVTDSSGTVYGFISTHYRLTFSVANGAFSVTRSIVSGPVEWSVPKHINVIAYPTWDGRLTKAGNTPSRILTDARAASVYCYYDRNDLKLLTVSTSTLEARETRTSSPEYFGGKSYQYPTAYLRETESGTSYGEKLNANAGTCCEFSLDVVVVGGETKNATRVDYAAEWIGRFPLTVCLGSGYDSDTSSSFQTDVVSMDINMPDLDYSFDGLGRVTGMTTSYPETFSTGGPGHLTQSRHFYGGVWKQTIDTYTLGQGINTIVVIPYNDSQSVFLSEKISESKSGTKLETYGSHLIAGSFEVSMVYSGAPSATHYGPFIKYGLASFPLADAYVPGGAPVNTNTNDTTTTHDNNLVTTAGAYGISAMPGEGDFYSTLDVVSQNYETNSSVNGAIISRAVCVESGAPAFPNKMAFLGWC